MQTLHMKNSSRILAFMLFTVTLFTACIKTKYDAPPTDGVDPNLTPTMTIAEFKQLFTGTSVEIQDSILLAGIIIADDKSGNFYKTLVFQDATAGIAIRLDATGLANSYMIGRKIYVKTKGLFLGSYGNMVQLGGAATAGSPTEVDALPSSLITRHIIKGGLNNEIIPITVTIPELNDAYQNRLIKLENVQFSPADTGFSYADGLLQLTKNVTVQDCNGNTIILRNSGYATFANALLPSGKGTLTVVYSVFGTTKQLYIRDLYDVVFDQPRCGTTGGGGGSVTLFEEKFDGYTNNQALVIPGWAIIAETGSLLWRAGTAGANGTNPFAKCSAYSTSNQYPTVRTWMITPEIDLTQTTQEKLEFRGCAAFDNGALMKLYISTNYTSGNPNTATWTELSFNPLPTSPDNQFPPFTSSGLIDISSYDGVVRLGWVYEGGNSTNQTTTWEVDNIVVTGEQ